MSQTHSNLQVQMHYTQSIQEQDANASITPALRFAIGHHLWLSTKNIKTACPSKKLDHKRLGPFPISEVVGSHAYQLILAALMRIHSDFHVSLPEPASLGPMLGQVMQPPTPVEIEGDEEMEVEELLDSWPYRRQPQYLVKCLGEDAPTWLQAHNLGNSAGEVKCFHLLHPTGPGPW